MTDSEKLTGCYQMAENILRPFEKGTKVRKGLIDKSRVDDPLAYVCLAHLLFDFKYGNKSGETLTT